MRRYASRIQDLGHWTSDLGLPSPYVKLSPVFMGDQPAKQFLDRRKVTKRRRILFWTLGATVLLLLFVIISQQLWLWNIVPLESASDTVVLYALSTLNFIAFVVFLFIFVRRISIRDS